MQDMFHFIALGYPGSRINIQYIMIMKGKFGSFLSAIGQFSAISENCVTSQLSSYDVQFSAFS